jgi:hypothetical protein
MQPITNNQADFKTAVCRAPAECQSSQAPSGWARHVVCALTGQDCNGKSCAPLTSRYSVVYPRTPLNICAD